MSRLRRIFDGTGPFSGFAIACWLIGLIGLVTILMSPNGLDWWLNVRSVQGHETDGLVYYSVHGVRYTLNDARSFAGSASHARTVYYLPSQPDDASLHNTGNQILDWGTTALPGVIGLALFGIGFLKRRRRPSLVGHSDPPDTFGRGLPAETIRAIVARDRNLNA